MLPQLTIKAQNKTRAQKFEYMRFIPYFFFEFGFGLSALIFALTAVMPFKTSGASCLGRNAARG